MKKTYEELQDEALIGEGGNICDISIDKLRSPTMKKLHKSSCPVPEKDTGMHRAAQKAGMSRAERGKLYNSVTEAESRKDALKRAAAIAKWKKAGGKVEKQPPSPGRGDEKMGKAVQDYKKKHKKKENRIGAGNMFKRVKKRKNSSFIPREEEVGEGFQEISNLVDITRRTMDKMIKAMKQEDYKSVNRLYKELGNIIK
jgi:hypothetical protein